MQKHKIQNYIYNQNFLVNCGPQLRTQGKKIQRSSTTLKTEDKKRLRMALKNENMLTITTVQSK